MRGAGSRSRLRSKGEICFEDKDCEVENIKESMNEREKIVELEK